MSGLADLYAVLRAAIAAEGSQKAWAKRHGISPQYVNDVLNARRDPGMSILRALGWKRVITYRKSNQA